MTRTRTSPSATRARFWILLVVTVVLTLTACGSAVTAVALRTRFESRTVRLATPPIATPYCGYPRTDLGAPDAHAWPVPPARPTRLGLVTVVVRTNLGELTLELDGRAAPCTVNAFLSLAESRFHNGGTCHRLTTGHRWLLHCGDPDGTGAGGPGFRFDDEHLPLRDHPSYPRGVLAMANTAPGANGSQFFVAYRDSDLDPYYPVFGRVVAGMEIIDRVAAAGTEGGALDGRPRLGLRIEGIRRG